jgi:hypothetical protein
LNRKNFIQKAGALPLAAGLPVGGLASSPASAEQAGATRLYSDTMPDMLVTYLTERVNAVAAHWDRQRARIRTPEQLEARNRFVPPAKRMCPVVRLGRTAGATLSKGRSAFVSSEDTRQEPGSKIRAAR